MKIGIGVTTYNRPKHMKLFDKQMYHFPCPTPRITFQACDDNERKGIAFRKNQCLKFLKDCDYIFLFDDDCFPIKLGWAEYFIEAHKASGQHHFLYLKDTTSIKRIGVTIFSEPMPEYFIGFKAEGKTIFISRYNNCGGCFMFLTKEAIEKVGAFDESFGLYGFEHADYSERIHLAGLTPMGKYLCPAGAGEYIYAMDYDNHLPFNKQVGHKPSMPPAEMLMLINNSRKVYESKQKNIFLPL